MSSSLTVELSRMRAVAVLGCVVVAGVLLFAAGTATGLLISNGQSAPSGTQMAKWTVEPLPSPHPAASNQPGASSQGIEAATPASVTTLATVPPEPPAIAANPSVGSQSATPALQSAPAAADKTRSPAAIGSFLAQGASTTASADSVDIVPLAIRVCSFEAKTSAENMVASLASRGYRASVVHSSGAQGRSWYVVEMGPYSAWNTASTVAAHVAIAENVRPLIGPAR